MKGGRVLMMMNRTFIQRIRKELVTLANLAQNSFAIKAFRIGKDCAKIDVKDFFGANFVLFFRMRPMAVPIYTFF